MTLGWNHSGTERSAGPPPHISDAISKTRRERVTLGLMAGMVLMGISYFPESDSVRLS
jgi:hypothetical protein